MFYRFACLLAFACVGSATEASAQAPDEFARNGPYLGVAGTVGIYTELNNTLDQINAEVDPTLGVNARAGYRLHPNFAIEAQFEWLAETDLDAGFADGDTTVGPTWLVTGNAKGFILTGRIQPYGVLGLGYLDVDDKIGPQSDGQFAARLGGGVDIYITPHILGTLGASYVIPDDELHDFAYVSVVWGFGYRF